MSDGPDWQGGQMVGGELGYTVVVYLEGWDLYHAVVAGHFGAVFRI